MCLFKKAFEIISILSPDYEETYGRYYPHTKIADKMPAITKFGLQFHKIGSLIEL